MFKKNTLRNYEYIHRKFQDHFNDIDLSSITSDGVLAFMSTVSDGNTALYLIQFNGQTDWIYAFPDIRAFFIRRDISSPSVFFSEEREVNRYGTSLSLRGGAFCKI
jgi:hypothetical protein